ncbi:C4-dicarboxylate TRAP transporter substrate-binding protein [Rhodococcus sp. 1168]|uniref:C4-dicarboxylate TRAP transporter substrate-binding protein n=1 Tax=Rhodococcus sp. 1168 TaxID=2018041 RepID=UPI000A0E20C7|nr:C4-dicarboxylate TRAP transporter substrate-binding protein [Rhodococcus sp. 1168]ORI26554.1 ABC transporter substrate-binding protein [Rhodococcus sp. 1168]
MHSLRRVGAALGAATILAGSLTACGNTSGSEYVLHYSTYSNATSDQSKTVQRWAEDVERLTDGAVNVRFHYSESLVGAEESVAATLDGRVDLAQVGSLYAASDLAMYTASELPFESTNPESHLRAINRMYHENETFREDFDRQGVRLLFPLPIGNATLGSTVPTQSLDDLRGRSIRSGGLLSEVMVAAGVNPVAMTATDVYESMERGIISGYTSLGMSNLPTFGLADSTPYIVDPGVGAYASSIVVVNEDLFQEMPEKYQKAVLEAGQRAIGYGLEELDALGSRACEQLLDSGAEFSALPSDELDRLREETGADRQWVSRYEARGYDAQSVLDDYRALIAEENAKSDYVDALPRCLQEAQ